MIKGWARWKELEKQVKTLARMQNYSSFFAAAVYYVSPGLEFLNPLRPLESTNSAAFLVLNLASLKNPGFVRARSLGLLMQTAQLVRAVGFQGEQRHSMTKAVQGDGCRLGSREF